MGARGGALRGRRGRASPPCCSRRSWPSAGPGDAFELLSAIPLLDFGDYQSLPFPLAYDGPLNTGSPGGFLSDSAESLLLFYLPLALVLALAGGARGRGAAVPARGLVAGRGRACSRSGCCTTCSRAPTLFHTAPLAVMVGGARGVGGAGARRAAAAAGAAAAVAAAGLAFARRRGRSTALWLVARDGGTPLDLPVADGVRVPERTARELEAAVRAIQARVPPGEPIYVAPRAQRPRHGRQPAALRARRPAEPDALRHPGAGRGHVGAGPARDRRRPRAHAPARRRARHRRRVTAAPEPNAAGRSSGVTLLDDYLARTYREAERYGRARASL